MADNQASVERQPQLEKREAPTGNTNEQAARMDVMGNWKAVYMGYNINVRPAQNVDLEKVLGMISKAVEKKESGAKDNIASEPLLEEKGKQAKKQVFETGQAAAGTVEFMDELRKYINPNAVGAKTSELFILNAESEKYIADWKNQADLKGPKFALNLNNIANGPVEECFLLKPDDGENLKKVFSNHGHEVVELQYGKGFQAEIGGLHLAFLYPDKFVFEKDKDADDKKMIEDDHIDEKSKNIKNFTNDKKTLN